VKLGFPWMPALAVAAFFVMPGNATAQQFQTPVHYQPGPNNGLPMGIVSADFNHDGAADLAASVEGGNRIAVLLNAQ
jgi:hypothetical protein